MRSYSIATVHDLRQKSHTVIGERRRTKTNETEKETTRAPQPAKPTPADRCLCGQSIPGAGTPQTRRRVFRYDHGHEPKPEAHRDR
jgi:hypothetical protein